MITKIIKKLTVILKIIGKSMNFKKNIKKLHFNIHGDNIIECERVFELITKSLKKNKYKISQIKNSIICPKYSITINKNKILFFQFFPGFGRWNANILNSLKIKGGLLREAPDILLTKITNQKEEPILALEFCAALPAGNQAWQRSGRAYSTGLTGIPYFYIAELGGYELSNAREEKAPRLPNPAVPFSYISFSNSNSTVLPIFIPNQGANDESLKKYKDIFCTDELSKIIESVLFSVCFKNIEKLITQKVLKFILIRADESRTGITLNKAQWEKAYSIVKNKKDLIDHLIQSTNISWGKKTSIKITPSAEKIMCYASKHAIGLTSSNLPLCIIPKNKRKHFAKFVCKLHKNLTDSFKKWLSSEKNLVISWLAGFKPRGDDSRPDRGLCPFAKMLINNDTDLMVFVYGPAKIDALNDLHSKPNNLLKNGLWESIFKTCDALLVDSTTISEIDKGYTKSHWNSSKKIIDYNNCEKNFLVSSKPVKIGENDIDTVIHNIFKHFADSDAFEGMCNPPGGDWSGITLFDKNKNNKLKWLSLPRVSGKNKKRPDHVIQIFNFYSKPIIILIESKENAKKLEDNINIQLINYLELLDYPPSIRSNDNKEWKKNKNESLSLKDFVVVTGVAYIKNKKENIQEIFCKTEVDFIFSFSFDIENNKAEIKTHSNSNMGEKICEFVSKKLKYSSKLLKID